MLIWIEIVSFLVFIAGILWAFIEAFFDIKITDELKIKPLKSIGSKKPGLIRRARNLYFDFWFMSHL